MTEEKQESIEQDWRNNISTSKSTLKIADGQVVYFVFMSEGELRHHSEFGDSIAFNVSVDEEEKTWYISPKNFSLLGQVKELGKLIGLKVEVERHGSKKSDTRYTIKKAD